MNHATHYHIGIHYPIPGQKTTAIAPTVGRVRQLDATNKRCRRGTERPTTVRTDSHVTDGFLKCTFLPKLRTEQSAQPSKETAKMERDFYQSLSHLAEHYRIEPIPTQNFGFPYNMALAMWDMETKAKRTNIDWDGFTLVQDSEKTFFISEERYNTGATLYYIPVLPLYQMLKDTKRKKTAHLLISVCSYLYHVVDIPYYRQEESYLYWMYEMHKDWIEQDEEAEETENYRREFEKAEFVGDSIEQRLFNRTNLSVFEQRLSRFTGKDSFDRECWRIACNAFAIYTAYPSASIFRNGVMPDTDPYEDDYGDTECIGMEKYISFIADTKGWLFENLKDSINNEFNEYGMMEEPIITKRFDGSEISDTNLHFENRVFELLDDLCALLDEYKTTAG